MQFVLEGEINENVDRKIKSEMEGMRIPEEIWFVRYSCKILSCMFTIAIRISLYVHDFVIVVFYFVSVLEIPKIIGLVDVEVCGILFLDL